MNVTLLTITKYVHARKHTNTKCRTMKVTNLIYYTCSTNKISGKHPSTCYFDWSSYDARHLTSRGYVYYGSKRLNLLTDVPPPPHHSH